MEIFLAACKILLCIAICYLVKALVDKLFDE